MKKKIISTASLGSIFNSVSKTFSHAVITIISFTHWSVMKCNILNIKRHTFRSLNWHVIQHSQIIRLILLAIVHQQTTCHTPNENSSGNLVSEQYLKKQVHIKLIFVWGTVGYFPFITLFFREVQESITPHSLSLQRGPSLLRVVKEQQQITQICHAQMFPSCLFLYRYGNKI